MMFHLDEIIIRVFGFLYVSLPFILPVNACHGIVDVHDFLRAIDNRVSKTSVRTVFLSGFFNMQ